jgi:hypothetical protein
MSSTKIITSLFHPTLELNEQRATATRYRRTHLCYILQRPCNICLMSFRAGNLCPRHSVVLPTYTFEVRKRLLIISLAKLRQNSEEALKNYELFIYGDIHYIAH